MKKLVVTLIATGMLLGFGTAFAQASQAHNVTVNIPSLLMIRITDGGTAEAANPSVTFDYSTLPARQEEYMTAISGATGTELAPTSVNAFSDVLVFSSQMANWALSVIATDPGVGFDVADILVRRGVTSGLSNVSTATANAMWPLGTGLTQIYAGGGRTTGWKSLGFNGQDYRIFVDGTETPGDYTTTVTYSFTAP